MANHLNEIKKSVSFIFVQNEKGQLVPNGTGFFVGVRNEESKENFNVYFVTAKHVLQDKTGNYHPEIVLRLNKKNGDSDLIKLKTEELGIIESPDKDVDIAVFNCLPSQEKYDFKFIPNEMISNKELIEKHEIAEGDDVFFTGLFTAYLGQKKNQPIIRFGKVALMPEEKIEWKEKGKDPKLMDLYLLECQSFGGNSGSPVFFQLNPMRKPGQIVVGQQSVFLAGIMTGSFLNGSEIQVVQNAPSLVSTQNIGIAAITPANKLHEILFSTEAIKSRKAPGIKSFGSHNSPSNPLLRSPKQKKSNSYSS